MGSYLSNVSKSFLTSLISTVIGLMISSLIFFFAIDHIVTFWALLILIWICISFITGYFLKDRIDCIISSAFTSGIIFLLMILLTIIISGLSSLFLDFIDPDHNLDFDEAGIATQAIVISIIVTLIIAGITISFSLIGTFVLKQRMKIQKPFSSAEHESHYFKQYESPKDAGHYYQKNDDDEI